MTAITQYSRLRKAAEQRAKRLEAAGFTAYHAPKVKDIKPEDIVRETRKIERWLNRADTTVPGARVAEERRAAEAAERRARHAAAERERYRRKQAEKGRVVHARPPKLSDEERRQRKRESNRRYREKKRQEGQTPEQGLKNLWNTDPVVALALQNLLSGLRKWDVEVKNFRELAAWGVYIKERKADADTKHFYFFDQWLDDVLNLNGNSPAGIEPARHAKAEDIFNLVNDFNAWKADQAALEEMFTAPRKADEYSGEEFGNMWNNFLASRDAD